MSVASRTTHIITCDRDGCTHTVRSAYNVNTAQERARQQGWQVSYYAEWDGGQDFCPEHREEGSQHGDYTTDRV